MMGRVLLAALLSGIAAGLFMSGIQAWKVTPLIIAAETYEGQETGHHQHGAEETATEETGHNHGTAWAPEDGFERIAFTVLSNIIAGVAFSLVLTAVIMFLGLNMSPGHGAMLGFAGFIAVSLAPSAGLSPELPGMPAAELMARQTWWWGTVIATGIGIGVIAIIANPLAKAGGAIMIALPHLIGAPHPVSQDSAVPAVLAAQFAANSLVTAAVFWVVLGALLGWALSRVYKGTEPVPE